MVPSYGSFQPIAHLRLILHEIANVLKNPPDYTILGMQVAYQGCKSQVCCWFFYSIGQKMLKLIRNSCFLGLIVVGGLFSVRTCNAQSTGFRSNSRVWNSPQTRYFSPRYSPGVVNGNVEGTTYQSYRPSYGNQTYYNSYPANGGYIYPRVYNSPNTVHQGNVYSSPQPGYSYSQPIYSNQQPVYSSQQPVYLYPQSSVGRGYYTSPSQARGAAVGGAIGGAIGGQRGANIGAAIGSRRNP